jgi:hypothetical protein
MLTRIFEFEVSFPIQVFGLNEGCFLFLVVVEQDDIAGEILLSFNSDDVSDLEVLPLPSAKSVLGQ